jgi:hypothetical protein
VTNTNPQTPILLLQWLDNFEIKEIRPAFRIFRREVNISYAEVSTKPEFLSAIESWLNQNRNAQFLYIGSHGSPEGLGPNARVYITWLELGNFLQRLGRRIAVWLGACDSSYASNRWKITNRRKPALYIVGFNGVVSVGQLQRALRLLLKMTRIENVISVEDELPSLRKILPRSLVTLHYPARLDQNSYRYLNADKFKAQLGVTFAEYIHTRGRLPKRKKPRKHEAYT